METGCVTDGKQAGIFWWNVFQTMFMESYGDAFETQRALERRSLERTINEFHSSADPAELSEMMFAHWTRPPIFDDSKKFFETCPVPVYIVSNIDTADIVSTLEFHGLNPAGVFTSEDAKAYKPQKELFQLALRSAGLKGSEVVHIGDSMSSDVKGAGAAGINAIWLNRSCKAVPEALILQICRYAEFYLKDILENTSIGELYYGEGEPFPHDGLLGMLQYFSFGILYIEEPPASAAGSDRAKVFNFSGDCDWQEDEGIQCLVRDGEVVFLGGFGGLSVWNDHSGNYIGNYVLYEKRDELRKKAAEKRKEEDHWKIGRFAHWKKEGLFQAVHRLEFFTDLVLASRENTTPENATRLFENTYLYRLMGEYPELMEEDVEFWYECYCIEKETDAGKLVEHICENCQWDMF